MKDVESVLLLETKKDVIEKIGEKRPGVLMMHGCSTANCLLRVLAGRRLIMCWAAVVVQHQYNLIT